MVIIIYTRCGRSQVFDDNDRLIRPLIRLAVPNRAAVIGVMITLIVMRLCIDGDWPERYTSLMILSGVVGWILADQLDYLPPTLGDLAIVSIPHAKRNDV